jgi:hypothetical protein
VYSIRNWVNVDRWPSTQAKDRAYRIFHLLDQIEPSEYGATADEDEAIPNFRFAPDAQLMFDEWRNSLEHRLRAGELFPALEAHLAKYRSLMPSLALIFHLVEAVDTGKSGAVSKDSALKAIAWCDYLESHARRLYSSAEDPAM